jgi:hypothetical protein
MSYRIEHSKKIRESFGDYTYDIYKDGRLVAVYWHDYRGDDHGIVFLNGGEEKWPEGSVLDFLANGGGNPKSPELSEKAIGYLNEKLRK